MSAPARERFFPRWTPVAGGVIGPEERLPWGQTLVVGLQHVFAMFGATVLVPILMGFDPNTSVFFSGIGTLCRPPRCTELRRGNQSLSTGRR